MSDLDTVLIGSLAIRAINAFLWTIVCVRIVQHDQPVPRIIRLLIVTVILGGMWVLTFGGLAPFGVPGEVARFIYTAYTAYAGIIAVAIVTDPISDLSRRKDTDASGNGHKGPA
jgi:hypothetical protein